MNYRREDATCTDYLKDPKIQKYPLKDLNIKTIRKKAKNQRTNRETNAHFELDSHY